MYYMNQNNYMTLKKKKGMESGGGGGLRTFEHPDLIK